MRLLSPVFAVSLVLLLGSPGTASAATVRWFDWVGISGSELATSAIDGSTAVGVLRICDGSVRVACDGSVMPTGGSAIPGDGSVLPGDGSVLPGGGSVLPGGGLVLPADGSVRAGDGLVFVGLDGSRTFGDGSVRIGDGSVLVAFVDSGEGSFPLERAPSAPSLTRTTTLGADGRSARQTLSLGLPTLDPYFVFALPDGVGIEFISGDPRAATAGPGFRILTPARDGFDLPPAGVVYQLLGQFDVIAWRLTGLNDATGPVTYGFVLGVDENAFSVPAPATAWLLLLGLAAGVATRRRLGAVGRQSR